MRYDDFRDQWLAALQKNRLLAHHDRPSETIDVATTERRWECYVGHALPQRADPFHVTAKLEFRWDPFESARSFTSEEDLLRELVGRKRGRTVTQPRQLRIDLTLHGTLPYGTTAPLPAPEIWGPWIASVDEKLETLLPITNGGRKALVVSWRGDMEIEACSTPSATLALTRLSIPAFELVRLPRAWSDSERQEKEKGIGAQLDRVTRRFRSALDAWMACVGELGRWNQFASARTIPPRRTRDPRPRRNDEPPRTH